MPCELPAGVVPGEICRHERFYRDRQGNWQRKYLLVLAGTPAGDVIYRLLTSRAAGRRRRLASMACPIPVSISACWAVH
jgi:hypothetical protein